MPFSENWRPWGTSSLKGGCGSSEDQERVFEAFWRHPSVEMAYLLSKSSPV